MAALDFPSSPTLGQVYTANGKSWKWDGITWQGMLLEVVFETETQTLTNKTIEKAILNDGYTEEVFIITDGATVNLDPNNGSIQIWTLGDNRTPEQANWVAGQNITVMVNDDANFTITWSTLGVVWLTDSGVAPTLASNEFTTIVLWKVSTQIYGARVGNV